MEKFCPYQFSKYDNEISKIYMKEENDKRAFSAKRDWTSGEHPCVQQQNDGIMNIEMLIIHGWAAETVM